MTSGNNIFDPSDREVFQGIDKEESGIAFKVWNKIEENM